MSGKIKSVSDWKKDGPLQAELKKVLDNPAFIAAVETLKHTMVPTVPGDLLMRNSISPEEVNGLAYRQAHTAGFYFFPTSLRSLADEIPTPNPVVEDPWDYVANKLGNTVTTPASSKKQK